LGVSTRDPVTVVVADDHPMYREGVARGLSGSGRATVVAEAADGREALDAIRRHQPQVAVVDYRLPGLDGSQVANAVHRDALPTRVLILSAFSDSELVYRAIEQGAAGYLPKESRQVEILDAVLACSRGETVIPPALAGGLAEELRRHAAPGRKLLTPREAQVLSLVAEGKSVPAIAQELVLGSTTVKTHIGHLYEKLGVSDRAAAVAEAMRRGLIE
jgi:two-component system, NarL family, nitrate/nitrite response regulator NarL